MFEVRIRDTRNCVYVLDSGVVGFRVMESTRLQF